MGAVTQLFSEATYTWFLAYSESSVTYEKHGEFHRESNQLELKIAPEQKIVTILSFLAKGWTIFVGFDVKAGPGK